MANIFNKNYLINYFLEINLYNSVKYASGILLDVGCNDKPYENIFTQKVDKYIGLDLPPDNKDVNTYNKCKADVFANALEMPLESNSIDTLLCLRMLEDVPDTALLIKEFFRVLKDEGVIIVDVSQSWRINDPPHDYYRFTKYGLEYLFNNNGFSVLSITEEGGMWTLIGVRIVFWFNEYFAEFTKLKSLVKYVITPLMNFFFILMYKIQNLKNDPLGLFLIARKYTP